MFRFGHILYQAGIRRSPMKLMGLLTTIQIYPMNDTSEIVPSLLKPRSSVFCPGFQVGYSRQRWLTFLRQALF